MSKLWTWFDQKQAELRAKSGKTLLNPGLSNETELRTHLNPPNILNPQTGFDPTLFYTSTNNKIIWCVLSYQSWESGFFWDQTLLVLLWEHLLSTLSISCCYCNAQCILNLNINQKIWFIWHFTKNQHAVCGNSEKCWMHFVFEKTLSISGHTVWVVTRSCYHSRNFLPLFCFFFIFRTRNHT